MTAHKQTTDGVAYTTGYSYGWGGQLLEEEYPSTRKVRNVLDDNGDLSLVQSKKYASSGYWNYAQNFTYNAAGAVTSMQLGNGTWETTEFNSRMQPTQIALGKTPGATNLLKLDYSYGDWVSGSINTAKNNGNIIQQVITVPNVGQTENEFTATQRYYYDSLNRIDDATEHVDGNQTWRQDFQYDRFGNRNFVEPNTTTIPRECGTSPNLTICASDQNIYNPTINTANNNRIDTGEGYSFDTAGNTLGDAQGRKFTYDGENKQVVVKNASNVTIGEYWYDGDGKRVKKKAYDISTGALTEETIFVYDASGKLIEEYSTNVAAPGDAEVAYLTNDHLGSPRINTDRDGDVISRHDYHPFGEEISTAERGNHPEYTPDTVRKQFTGYERDGETELEFAQARYYSKLSGRFNSVDPKLESISPANPQTLNRYSYALNNPLVYIDPDGEEPLRIGQWSDLTDEQKRLFVTYVESNYSLEIEDGDPAVFAETFFNQSADSANGEQIDSDGRPLLSQSQLTAFIGTTSMLESRGVIEEVASIHTIKGDETPKGKYRIQGDLKNNNSSVKAIEKAFSHSIRGKGHGEYSISRRERWLTGEPNGQVTRIPNATGIEVDVDYRCILCRDHTADDGSNSDIRADTGKESHYKRHKKAYGAVRALMPVIK